MRKIILLVVAITLLAAPGLCYEFHLLNGMVVKGDLTGFSDGAFLVRTDVGSMRLEVGRLDYIIVEESDGTLAGAAAPGMPVDSTSVQGGGKDAGRQGGATRVEVMAPPSPAPVAPQPFMSHSVKAARPPAPFFDWSMTRQSDRDLFPGLFRGRPE